MFSVRGKFKSGHTFSLTPVTANDARGALDYVMSLDDVKSSPHGAVIAVFVKSLEGKKRVRISEKPAAGRKAKAAAPAPAKPAQTARR